MGVTTQKYLNLKNIILTMGSGVVVDCTNISIKRNPIYIERPATGALLGAQIYNGENPPDIMIEGINNDDLSFGDIVPNDPVETFTLTDNSDVPAALLQSDFFTKWPVTGWVFGEVETDFTGSDISTWKIPIKAGVLNPNETGE